MEEKNGDKKVIKIGRLTFGLSLVLVGIIVIIATFSSLDVLRIILVGWPVLLIIAGIEIIVCSRKETVEVKYDVLGMFLTAIVIFSSFIFCTINYGVNKILYSNEIKNQIIEEATNKEYSFIMSGKKIKIENNEEKEINVVIKKNENKSSNFITVQGEYNLKSKNVVSAINSYSHGIDDILDINYDENIIKFNGLIEDYNNITILILTNEDIEVQKIGNVK